MMNIVAWLLASLQQRSRYSLPRRRLRGIRVMLDDLEPPDRALTADEQDHIVIEYEDVFEWRFGFCWRRWARIELIELKNTYQLTDLDIKVLYRSGNLRCRSEKVHLYASRATAAMGWLQMSYLVLLLGLSISASLQHIATHPNHAAKALLLAAAFGSFCAITYVAYIFPWTLRRRAS